MTYRELERWAYNKSTDTGEYVCLTGVDIVTLGVERQAMGLKGWKPDLNSYRLIPSSAALRRMHRRAKP